MRYADRLADAILAKDSRVCVGLDPRIEFLPPALGERAQRGPEEAATAYVEFCAAIVEAVADHAVAVKPQAAFFEALGPPGYAALWDVMALGKARDLIVILDAKRSDIASTAAAYAEGYFEPRGGRVGPDAITVNGYLGSDGVQPFVQAAVARGGGVYVLVKTSNPSCAELQDLQVEVGNERRLLYQQMGRLVEKWGEPHIGKCGYSVVGAVVGGTYPKQLAELRQMLPTVPFLVPGFGAQGARAEDVVPAFDRRGLGAIVNSSREIIYAYRDERCGARFGEERYAQAAAAATVVMKDAINLELQRRRTRSETMPETDQ